MRVTILISVMMIIMAFKSGFAHASTLFLFGVGFAYAIICDVITMGGKSS